jgi:hypothetical protein
MSKVKIEKFVDGRAEKTIKIPTRLISAGAALLPKSAITALASEGVDVCAILEAMKRKVSYTSSVDVCEHGINKRVVVSLTEH